MNKAKETGTMKKFTEKNNRTFLQGCRNRYNPSCCCCFSTGTLQGDECSWTVQQRCSSIEVQLYNIFDPNVLSKHSLVVSYVRSDEGGRQQQQQGGVGVATLLLPTVRRSKH